MTKRYYNPHNETAIVAAIIMILTNIYVFLNDKLTLSIGIFSNIFIYIEVFYAILLIFYNILLFLASGRRERRQHSLTQPPYWKDSIL